MIKTALSIVVLLLGSTEAIKLKAKLSQTALTHTCNDAITTWKAGPPSTWQTTIASSTAWTDTAFPTNDAIYW
jgi:hypothetical protein